MRHRRFFSGSGVRYWTSARSLNFRKISKNFDGLCTATARVNNTYKKKTSNYRYDFQYRRTQTFVGNAFTLQLFSLILGRFEYLLPAKKRSSFF